MTLLTLDIETIPNEQLLPFANDAMPYPGPEQAPSNYKSPEAIAKWVENAQSIHGERVIKRMSLDPILGRIVCIGTMSWDPLTDMPDLDVFTVDKSQDIAAQEKAILLQFWAKASVAAQSLSFNGLNFDLPFIEKRSRILGITHIPVVRETHIDLMRETSTRTYTGGYDNKSLTELRKWFGIPVQTDHTGADVYTDYQKGDMATIASHCADDVNATFEISRRLNLV